MEIIVIIFLFFWLVIYKSIKLIYKINILIKLITNICLNNYLFLFICIISIFIFINFYKQILIILLRLEFLILRLLILINRMIILNNRIIIILYFLIFIVCERVLGLTLLIILIRSYGNDNVKLLRLIIW